MTGDGFGLDAFELLVWVTLIPLFVVLLGRARHWDDTDGDTPGDENGKAPRRDEPDGPKRE